MRTLLYLIIVSVVAACATSCAADAESFATGSDDGLATGVSSSYARLIAAGDYLYAINLDELVTFDATDPADPREVDRQSVGGTVETLFHLSGTLFVGSPDGTYTYSIDADGIPRRRGRFDYNTLDLPVTPCDPVVSDGRTAYATLYTLRDGGGPCARTTLVETLVVMDVTDLDKPTLIAEVYTPSPRGLALAGNALFVCNEASGLTVYDVSDPSVPTFVTSVGDVFAYDAVALPDGPLIVVGEDQLVQFDYADPANLVRLSTIEMRP